MVVNPCRPGYPTAYRRAKRNDPCTRMCRGRRSIGVGVRGLEPRASSLSGTRSNRLSYTPEGRPYRLGYSTAFPRLLASASIRLPQGHLDAADGLRDQVVD